MEYIERRLDATHLRDGYDLEPGELSPLFKSINAILCFKTLTARGVEVDLFIKSCNEIAGVKKMEFEKDYIMKQVEGGEEMLTEADYDSIAYKVRVLIRAFAYCLSYPTISQRRL
jgi:hypothetical protein